MSLLKAYLAWLFAVALYAVIASEREAQSKPRSVALGYLPKIKLIFAWYDFWCGVFYDRAQHRVYVFPIPMLGICIDFKGSR